MRLCIPSWVFRINFLLVSLSTSYSNWSQKLIRKYIDGVVVVVSVCWNVDIKRRSSLSRVLLGFSIHTKSLWVKYVQYCGGYAAQWRDIIFTVEGIHYGEWISSVRWRVIISILEGYHKCDGGYSVKWNTDDISPLYWITYTVLHIHYPGCNMLICPASSQFH